MPFEVRISSIRPRHKNLRLLIPAPVPTNDEQVETMVGNVMAAHSNDGCDIVGAAFVVWDRDGGSTADFMIEEGSPVIGQMLGVYLRARFESCYDRRAAASYQRSLRKD